MTVVSFGGLQIDDAAQMGWALSRLQGWYDAAPSRRSLRDRPQADGAFGVDRFFRGGRVISVEGSYIASGATESERIANAHRARDVLTSVQADGRSSAFAVTDPLGTRSTSVELVRGPVPDDEIYTGFFKWSFDVFAPDPRKYGPEQVATTGLPSAGTGIAYPITYPITYGVAGDPGRAHVSNDGTQETFSVFEVAGGLAAGFEVKEIRTGRRLRFEREVPLGSTVVLNSRTGRAYLDSPENDVSGFLTVREWWSVPPGGDQDIQFSTWSSVSGSPTLTVRTRPAY